MDRNNRDNRFRDIRNFLGVIFSGILCALLAAWLLVYYYDSGGRYVVDEVLLNPEVAGKLSHDDNHSGLVFDGVEHVRYEGANKGWVRSPLSTEAYLKFYQEIQEIPSLWEVPQALVGRFSTEKPESIVLTVKVENKKGASPSARVFQEVQILPDGYFRIELRQGNENNQWAYFYKKDLRVL